MDSNEQDFIPAELDGWGRTLCVSRWLSTTLFGHPPGILYLSGFVNRAGGMS